MIRNSKYASYVAAVRSIPEEEFRLHRVRFGPSSEPDFCRNLKAALVREMSDVLYRTDSSFYVWIDEETGCIIVQAGPKSRRGRPRKS